MGGSTKLADFAAALEAQAALNAGTLGVLKNGILTDTGSFFEPKPIVATSDGQTSFPVTYTVGPSLLVWGGSLLMEGYAASTGSSVVLADGSGVKSGDKGWLITLTPFAVANAVSLTGTAYDSARVGGILAANMATLAQLNAAIATIPGINQTNTNVTASRAVGTTYTNNTTRAIEVNIVVSVGAPTTIPRLRVGPAGALQVVYGVGSANSSYVTTYTISAKVPPGHDYVLDASAGTIGISNWSELR